MEIGDKKRNEVDWRSYLKRQAYENDEWINEKKAIKTFYEYTKKAYNTEITATPNYKK